MEHEPKTDIGSKVGWAGLIVAKFICCGAILLALSGGLAGASAWFLEDGALWLALAIGAIAAVGLQLGVRRARRGRRSNPEPQNHEIRAL